MRERDFSIRTRRTTRVAIRIPVQIKFRSENGDEEIFGAWTLIVNRHGARCEAARPLEPNVEVLVKNAANGKSATAVVVWGNNHPDSAGKFEFAVALRELCNLWQIHFPTQEELQELSLAECRTPIESESDRVTQERIGQIENRGNAVADEQLRRIAVVGEQYSRSVQEKAAEVVSASLGDLIQRIVRQMPPIEEEVVHRCQREAEQAASAAVGAASHKLSREFDVLVSTLVERETALLRQVTELEQRISCQLENSVHQLEAQLAETAKEVLGGHASNLIQGINAAQKNLVLAAEAKLAASSEHLISEMRNGFARTLQELALSFGDCQTEEKYPAARVDNFNSSTDRIWENSVELQRESA